MPQEIQKTCRGRSGLPSAERFVIGISRSGARGAARTASAAEVFRGEIRVGSNWEVVGVGVVDVFCCCRGNGETVCPALSACVHDEDGSGVAILLLFSFVVVPVGGVELGVVATV